MGYGRDPRYSVPPYGQPARPGTPVWVWVLVGCLGVFVLGGVVLAAIMFPVFSRARGAAQQASCASNLKQVSLGLLMYSQDYDQALPPSSAWMDAALPYIRNEGVLRCPAVPVGSYGYAYNSGIARRSLNDLGSPGTVVMDYDSTNLSRNASDPVTSRPTSPRHARGNTVGYVDGHVMMGGGGAAYGY